MNFRTLRSLFILAVLVMGLSATALAQADLGPQKGQTVTSSSSQLNITATGINAIQLDISTAASGAPITGTTGKNSTGVFAIDFGNVDGLGLSPSSSNVSVDITSSGATYTTPITLTPEFSGFANNAASVSVKLDATAGTALGRAAAREGAAANTVSAPSTTATVFTTTAPSGTNITRYVGLFVSNANGASKVTGSLASRIIYQVTVP